MNHYTYTRLAEQRLAMTARQARTAWWRSQSATQQAPTTPDRRTRLHWTVPVRTRIAGA